MVEKKKAEQMLQKETDLGEKKVYSVSAWVCVCVCIS